MKLCQTYTRRQNSLFCCPRVVTDLVSTIRLFNDLFSSCTRQSYLSNAVGYRTWHRVSQSRVNKFKKVVEVKIHYFALTGCNILRGKFVDWFHKIKMHLRFTFTGRCKIQKNWCIVTVAPTIEDHGRHSRTPAKQRWDGLNNRLFEPHLISNY